MESQVMETLAIFQSIQDEGKMTIKKRQSRELDENPGVFYLWNQMKSISKIEL